MIGGGTDVKVGMYMWRGPVEAGLTKASVHMPFFSRERSLHPQWFQVFQSPLETARGNNSFS